MRKHLTAVALAMCFAACSAGPPSGPVTPCTPDASVLGPGCPRTWGEARQLCDTRASCPGADVSCWYEGAGDILRQGAVWCGATANAQCGAAQDGGLQWVCAQ